jgi:hypothetical protein
VAATQCVSPPVFFIFESVCKEESFFDMVEILQKLQKQIKQ